MLRSTGTKATQVASHWGNSPSCAVYRVARHGSHAEIPTLWPTFTRFTPFFSIYQLISIWASSEIQLVLGISQGAILNLSENKISDKFVFFQTDFFQAPEYALIAISIFLQVSRSKPPILQAIYLLKIKLPPMNHRQY